MSTSPKRKTKKNKVPKPDPKKTPLYRMLWGYTIDPGFSTQLDSMGINECIYKIRWEELTPGPIGEYVEVMDIDPASNSFYDPVDLDAREILAKHGLEPDEGNAQFHQQFVYAATMQTIENFEKALGRRIIWRSGLPDRKGNMKYVQQLRVYPHAMRDANAYYTSEKVALLFGYFQAGNKSQGANFPGGVVFTCLSPDIVAHETTHAILDSIFPHYLEDTNPDVAAFHEAFADIVALLQRFSNAKLVEHQLAQTRGRLDEYSLLGELATQYGQALDKGRGALRGAIGKYDKKTGKWKKMEPRPMAYQNTTDAHDRGAILVATIFDAFLRLYNFRVKDLLRIATQGSGILPQGSIHPDLVKRLAGEASEIASHLLLVCIRALDYCPPFDITFGDYLRALITADADICPADNNNYRVALIEAFRAWGIFPDRVNTLSVYSLKWEDPGFKGKENLAMKIVAESIKDDVRKIARLTDRKTIWAEYAKVQSKLQGILIDDYKQNSLRKKHKLNNKIWGSFLKKIGIVSKPPASLPKNIRLQFSKTAPLEVHSVRPAFRIGREEKQIEQVIITLTQPFIAKQNGMRDFIFRGGSTIVLSIQCDELKVDYIILKSANSKHRLEEQYLHQVSEFSNSSTPVFIYNGDDYDGNLDFEKLHFH